MILTIILFLWCLLTAASVFYLICDLIKTKVDYFSLKVSWFLMVLYTGPVALYFYLYQRKNVDEQKIKALHSFIHTLAGAATGLILALCVLSFFQLGIGLKVFLSYFAAFSMSLFLFETPLLKKIETLSYQQALKKCFYSAVVLLNWMMAGAMVPIVIGTLLTPVPMQFLRVYGMASFATIAGIVTSYRTYQWFIDYGLKYPLTLQRE